MRSLIRVRRSSKCTRSTNRTSSKYPLLPTAHWASPTHRRPGPAHGAKRLARSRAAGVLRSETTLSGVGHGGRLRLSLWRGERNLMHGGPGPHGMTSEGEAFLAGVPRALPALTAIGCPTPAGYLRLAPAAWAGAYHCWGWENREAALRFVTGPVEEASHCANAELKGKGTPLLLECEVIEPSLFLTHSLAAVDDFAAAILRRLTFEL
ncbi:hypothetical protein ACIGO6_41050 [Streptomyces sp. NPDC053750]|uniref:hypothetical protein n=1 Tax=Streptomyces sp. NPDC053750 TaxID=3365714 RepID=UPI0037D8030D